MNMFIPTGRIPVVDKTSIILHHWLHKSKLLSLKFTLKVSRLLSHYSAIFECCMYLFLSCIAIFNLQLTVGGRAGVHGVVVRRTAGKANLIVSDSATIHIRWTGGRTARAPVSRKGPVLMTRVSIQVKRLCYPSHPMKMVRVLLYHYANVYASAPPVMPCRISLTYLLRFRVQWATHSLVICRSVFRKEQPNIVLDLGDIWNWYK